MPDVSDQYTRHFDQADFDFYWEKKMRGLHAFQISCALQALTQLDGEKLTIVDLGDSSGNHAAYLRALAPKGSVGRIIGVNLDETAVSKIRSKGGEAIHSRVEDIVLEGVRPDLIMCFETLEHIIDPIKFLRNLSGSRVADHLILTVPYRKNSRFGGSLLRQPIQSLPSEITPEETHIFELSPEDWRLLALFAGYRTIFTRIYRQYPRKSILRVTKPIWQTLDFEGFVGLFLERDRSLSDKYAGW